MKKHWFGSQNDKKQKLKRIVSSLVIILFINYTTVTAQIIKPSSLKFGVGYSSFLSGNGHGAFNTFYLNFNTKKSNFSIGPCIQKSSQRIRSFKITYAYKLADNGSHLRLNIFSYVFYSDKLPISYSTIKLEERQEKSMEKFEKKQNDPVNWANLKLSTIETGIGAELDIKISKNIVFRNFIGLTVFYHLNYLEGMYSDKVVPVLVLGTSINIYNKY